HSLKRSPLGSFQNNPDASAFLPGACPTMTIFAFLDALYKGATPRSVNTLFWGSAIICFVISSKVIFIHTLSILDTYLYYKTLRLIISSLNVLVILFSARRPQPTWPLYQL